MKGRKRESVRERERERERDRERGRGGGTIKWIDSKKRNMTSKNASDILK